MMDQSFQFFMIHLMIFMWSSSPSVISEITQKMYVLLNYIFSLLDIKESVARVQVKKQVGHWGKKELKGTTIYNIILYYYIFFICVLNTLSHLILSFQNEFYWLLQWGKWVSQIVSKTSQPEKGRGPEIRSRISLVFKYFYIIMMAQTWLSYGIDMDMTRFICCTKVNAMGKIHDVAEQSLDTQRVIKEDLQRHVREH